MDDVPIDEDFAGFFLLDEPPALPTWTPTIHDAFAIPIYPRGLRGFTSARGTARVALGPLETPWITAPIGEDFAGRLQVDEYAESSHVDADDPRRVRGVHPRGLRWLPAARGTAWVALGPLGDHVDHGAHRRGLRGLLPPRRTADASHVDANDPRRAVSCGSRGLRGFVPPGRTAAASMGRARSPRGDGSHRRGLRGQPAARGAPAATFLAVDVPLFSVSIYQDFAGSLPLEEPPAWMDAHHPRRVRGVHPRGLRRLPAARGTARVALGLAGDPVDHGSHRRGFRGQSAARGTSRRNVLGVRHAVVASGRACPRTSRVRCRSRSRPAGSGGSRPAPASALSSSIGRLRWQSPA